MPRTIKKTAPPASPIIRSLGEMGEAVRARRTHLGLRIDDAAAVSGVSVDLLSRLENASGRVGFENVLKVCAALGLHILVCDAEASPAVLGALSQRP